MTDPPNMKRQKMSSCEMSDLPDEVLLKILSYLNVKNLISCSHVSKKFRAISQDESLWQKVNLYAKVIPIDFLEMVLNNGCKYLNLEHSDFFGSLSLKKPSQLKCLDLSYSTAEERALEELLSSCHSLQKLSLEKVDLTPNMVNSICQQNKQSLKILNLNSCRININHQYQNLNLESVENIVRNCVELVEINFAHTRLSELSIDFLAKNLTPNIEKLSLSYAAESGVLIKDDHVKSLVMRCTKLTELDLTNFIYQESISDDSVTYIIEHLKTTLEKLDLGGCRNINPDKLLELKSMQQLKVFRYKLAAISDIEENLKKQMPHLMSTSGTRFGFGSIVASFTGEINEDIVNLFNSMNLTRQ